MIIEIDYPDLIGFNAYSTNNGSVILDNAFGQAKNEIFEILNTFQVPKLSIVKGCGNECPFITQLKNDFIDRNWEVEVNGLSRQKTQLIKKITRREYDQLEEIERTTFDNRHYRLLTETELEPSTHKIDIIKSFDMGTVGIDVEWNSKDSVYDRDLTNFQWLYQYGFISLGIIITRGETLVDRLKDYISEYYGERMPFELDDINTHSPEGQTVTPRQITDIKARFNTGNYAKEEAIASVLYLDKYGESTTHYTKLQNKINQGKGGFCPICVITIEEARVEA